MTEVNRNYLKEFAIHLASEKDVAMRAIDKLSELKDEPLRADAIKFLVDNYETTKVKLFERMTELIEKSES